MGLSASQARLLSITQRLSDNELHSEIIANSKMRLADEGIEAKNKYINALNATKLQYVGFDDYGNANPVDLTFTALMNYSDIKNQNILRNSNGQVLISETDANNFEKSKSMYDFLAKYGLYDPTDPDIDPNNPDFQDKAKTQWYINLWHALDGQENPSELRATYGEDGVFKSYNVENAFKITVYLNGQALNPSYQVIPEELKNDSSWLQHALMNGTVTLSQVIMDSNKNELVWSDLEYSSTSAFNEVADDKKLAQAEAEYQSEMKRIEIEDNKYDMKIKKLDTEHSALKTEYDSVAQLIGKNVERSYTTFNA